jgi:hypothetical protein
MPMDLCSVFKPMIKVERGDRQIEYAKILYEKHQSVMRDNDRTLVDDHITW